MNRPRYTSAISALTRMGGAAVPTLLEALNGRQDDPGDIEKGVTDDVVEVLRKIGDPRAVAPLRRLLGDYDHAVAPALATIPDPAALQTLLDATSDPDFTTKNRRWKELAGYYAPVPSAFRWSVTST